MKSLCIDGDNHDPTEEHVIARPNCRNGSCERVCWAFALSGGKQPPVPLRDDFDSVVDDFYGGLIVNRVHRYG